MCLGKFLIQSILSVLKFPTISGSVLNESFCVLVIFHRASSIKYSLKKNIEDLTRFYSKRSQNGMFNYKTYLCRYKLSTTLRLMSLMSPALPPYSVGSNSVGTNSSIVFEPGRWK